jgi:hypothetical protein
MKIFRRPYTLFCLLICVVMMSGCQLADNKVRQAVRAQMHQYPASTLQDIYKSFFQDEFGPGHLIGDTVAAREYFDYEMEDMTSLGRHTAEPCGTGKNFMRVPMDLVKDEIIPADQFFHAFLKSSEGFSTPDLMVWRKEWEGIFAEIKAMGIDLPDMDQENQEILKMLYHGEAAVHHSESYSKAYQPHYRIMSVREWDKLAR